MATEPKLSNSGSNREKSGIENPTYEDYDSGTSNPESDSDEKLLLKKENTSTSSISSPRPSDVTVVKATRSNSSKSDSNKSSDNLFRRTSPHNGRTVPCPTCNGKGKLSQAQSDTVLALIPIHDQRLKPKRTKLKLAIAFTVFLLIAGLCLAFLYPRHVGIQIQSVKALSISNHTQKSGPVVKIGMSVTQDLNNTNFFAVSIPSMTMQVLFLDTKDQLSHEVGSLFVNKTISLGIRKTVKRSFTISTVYLDADASIVSKVCLKYKQYFLIRVQLTATVKYWYHSEQISTSKFYYIDCSEAIATFTKLPINDKIKKPH